MRADFAPVWVITKRELRDQLRDWRIVIPIMTLSLIFPFIMNFTAQKVAAFVADYSAEIIGERLIPFLMMIVGFFPISVSLVIALESFAGEKERGSIEPLLTSPLDDWQLYLGKLIAVVIPPLLAAYLGFGVYVFGVYQKLRWLPEWELLLLMIVLTFVQAICMVAGAVVISTQSTSVRAANLLASFIVVPMSFLIQWESIVMFWGHYGMLWLVVFGLLIVTALLVRTGVSHFNREGLLGRDIDVLNFKWMGKEFWLAFTGGEKKILRWYRFQVFGTIRRLRIPLLIVLVLFGVGAAIGVYEYGNFPLPEEILQFVEFDQGIVEGFDQVQIFSGRGIPIILFHNIRAIFLATLLGMFTYGILGVLVLMLPYVIIGYLSTPVSLVGYPVIRFLMAFVLPHGIFEIPAMLFAGAIILRMGAGLAAPGGGKTVGQGLLHSWADWAKVMLGIVVPLLLLASLMETLVTPQIAIWFLSQ